MDLNPAQRSYLAARILAALQSAIPGSAAALRGSLAGSHSDRYSDIDVYWEVPSTVFPLSLGKLAGILAMARPVESIRSDPSLLSSLHHRLVFVRFTDTPLFWRLDLEIVAQSSRDDAAEPRHDVSEETKWTPAESALMNAIAAVKAHLRGNNALAREILLPGFQRIDLAFPAGLSLRDQITSLVDGIQERHPDVGDLAWRVEQLVSEAFPPP